MESLPLDAPLSPQPAHESAHAQAVRAALQEFEVLDRELARRKRENGIAYYVPNPMQHRAHLSHARTLCYSGGNRSGKSTFGAVELVWHLTKQYPDWYPEARRFVGPIKAVVVATEFPIVQRVIEPKVLTYLPKEVIVKLAKTPQGHLSRIYTKDGSTVDVLTNEMAQLAFEGADWDFAWVDEPTQRAKYIAIRRGLVDRGGQCVLTFTPIVEPWMKEEIVDHADGKAIESFTVDIRDNLFDIEGKPIQTEERIKEFESVLTEDEKQTRLHGKFFHLRGIVYGEYSPSVHERLVKYDYPDPVVCVLDPHTRKPHWVIWAVIRRDDSIYVDQELVMPGTLTELARQILLVEQRSGYKMRRRLIDPNFGRTPNLVTGRSVIDELRQRPYPLYFGEADDDKEAGILKVRELLHWDTTKPINNLNTPKLFFHPRVTKTIHGLRNYQFDDWRGVTKDDRDLKEVEKQKETDGPDCIRYLCLNHPTFDRLTHRDNAESELEAAVY